MKNYINLLKEKLLLLYLIVTWSDLFFLLYTCIIYLVIKSPINQFIYGNISKGIIGLLVAIIVGLVITWIKNKIFTKYTKILGHNKLQSVYVSDTLIVIYYKLKSYAFYTVLYHGANAGVWGNQWAYMPEPSEVMKRAMGERRIYLRRRHNICTRIIDQLEPVSSAIDRDRYNHRNTQLSQVFKEKVAEAKEELSQITETAPEDSAYYGCEYTQLTNLGRWTGWF